MPIPISFATKFCIVIYGMRTSSISVLAFAFSSTADSNFWLYFPDSGICERNSLKAEKFQRTNILNGKSTDLLPVAALMKKGMIRKITVIIGENNHEKNDTLTRIPLTNANFYLWRRFFML